MVGRRGAVSLALALLTALAIAAPAVAARNGDLDQSFGAAGTAIADFGSGRGSDGGTKIVLLPDGQILSAGAARGNGIGLVFYRRNGALDPSFTGGGQVYYQLEPGGTSGGEDYHLAPGAKIFLGGFEYDASSPDRGLVARFTPTGEIDTTFGNDPPRPAFDGKSVLDFGANRGDVTGVAPAKGGGTYVSGRTGTNASNDIFLARLRGDGSLDPAFGAGGLVIANPGENDEGDDVAVQRDGKVLIAGVTDSSLILLRFKPNGTPDTSFGGGDGAVAIPGLGLPAGANATIGVLPSGRIVVAVNDGESNGFSSISQMAVARFTAKGKVDRAFHGGSVEYPMGDSTYFSDMAIADDGRIVLVGYSTTGSETQAVVQRLLPGGELDKGFGSGGVVSYGNPGDFDTAFGVAIQRNRRIVVTGESNNGASDNRTTFRLLGDTIRPDTAFVHPPGSVVPPGKARIRFKVRRDVHARFQCSLLVGAGVSRPAAGSFHGCRSPLRLHARPNHSYLVRVRAIDRAGNVDPTPAKLRLRVR